MTPTYLITVIINLCGVVFNTEAKYVVSMLYNWLSMIDRMQNNCFVHLVQRRYGILMHLWLEINRKKNFTGVLYDVQKNTVERRTLNIIRIILHAINHSIHKKFEVRPQRDAR